MSDGSLQGSLDLDEKEVTQVLLDFVDVTENNGLKLPREFALLVKQSLYLQILENPCTEFRCHG